jgi:imidazolonepropionase-like amidohydrolase
MKFKPILKFKPICFLWSAVLWLSVHPLSVSQHSFAQAIPSQAFKNVTLHFADGTTLPKATIIWRNGVIESAGARVNIPFDAKIIDGGDSLHVYPGFIDGLTEWAMPEISRERTPVPNPGYPGYDRAGIQPLRNPHEMVVAASKDFSDWRKLGFTTAAVSPRGFMLPGAVDVMGIHNEGTGDAGKLVLPSIAQRASLSSAPGVNPSTTMGVMARYRQLFYDTEAYQTNHRLFSAKPEAYQAPEIDEVLAAMIPVIKGERRLFFVADNVEDIRRAIKLKREFGLNLVLVSGRQAGQIAEELKAENIPVLVSFNLAAKPEHMKKGAAADSTKEQNAEKALHQQRQAQAWSQDAINVQQLLKAGVQVGYAGIGLRSTDFQQKVKDLIEMGLSENNLLKIMTMQTARILGYPTLMGDLKTGMLAGFTVYTAPLLDSKTKLMYSISSGDLKHYSSTASGSDRSNTARGSAPRTTVEGEK